jgi:hypothetical protein
MKSGMTVPGIIVGPTGEEWDAERDGPPFANSNRSADCLFASLPAGLPKGISRPHLEPNRVSLFGTYCNRSHAWDRLLVCSDLSQSIFAVELMAKTFKRVSKLYSPSRRAFSIALTVACGLPLSAMMAMAHAPLPTIQFQPHPHPGSTPSFQAAPPSSTAHHSIKSLFRSGPVGVHTAVTPVNTGANLNLSSSQLNFLAGNLGNFSNLSIDVGGHTETVALSTKLTAAEVIALEQVIAGGGSAAQTINIGSNGAATGGTVSLTGSLLSALDNSLGGSISSLTIARHVDLIDSVTSLNLAGSLVNHGTIQTASGTTGNTDTIAAGAINNAAGGAIGSYGGSGAGAAALVGADVALSAATSLTNAGNITSAHDLGITAPIVNNTGLISAGSGNINIASNGALTVTGNGTWTASKDNINFSSANADINVTGANLYSQQVNFNAGSGNIYTNLGPGHRPGQCLGP